MSLIFVADASREVREVHDSRNCVTLLISTHVKEGREEGREGKEDTITRGHGKRHERRA